MTTKASVGMNRHNYVGEIGPVEEHNERHLYTSVVLS
jgi:hypothetical protein